MINEKINLFNFQTPLQQMNLRINNKNLFMKRDDLINFYFGGNKVRKYEYILREILEKKIEKIITFGSIHSNHVGITAAVAAHFNLECDIIILLDRNDKNIALENQHEGNSSLLGLFNTNRYYCYRDEAYNYISNHLELQQKQKKDYYFVPGGGHTALGALGYIDALKEIVEQCKNNNIEVDAIFLPTGTGTTQAGLIYGKKLLNFSGNIFGITVARSASRCKHEIFNILNELNRILDSTIQFTTEDIVVLEDYMKPYGQIDNEIIGTIKELAASDAVLLDPIYNGKAFAAMKKMLIQNQFEEYRNILYLNTGGLPNIFIKKFLRGLI